ncbi:MAG TPA: sigma-54 dependent transcriptional regulator [Kofleriaceae bacterium]|jgi:two-component system response regulator HydG|nr:sigma-54 dependent transcriptional regulator [Kofleriaceae bacterium]
MNGSVLVVDDDLDTAQLLRDGLRRRGLSVNSVHSAAECLGRLATDAVDVVITDIYMSDMTGLELCEQVRQRYPDVLSIVITGQSTLDNAIGAIRAGAYDFIVKPVKLDTLAVAVGRALAHLLLLRELKHLRTIVEGDMIDDIAGESPAIRETTEMVRRVSDSDATVLITGESGTGKELVARAIHRLSPRRTQPFVAVNCAAVPTPLLESELFGHVRGAFTDAKSTRPGLFIQAGTGTIFLDEIGEMPPEMQVKLLRVLQERKLRRVGGDEEVPFHARVLAATNRNLEAEIEQRRFREDLFYRINVVTVHVPPLRTRSGDILLLAQLFLRRVAQRIGKPVKGFSGPAARMLLDYDWPGNVRELENCVERAVALCRLDEITVDDLPTKVQAFHVTRVAIPVGPTGSPDAMITMEEMERRYVRQVLDTVGGNKTHAARILGIDRRSLYRRLETPYGTSSSALPPEESEIIESSKPSDSK